MRLSDVFFDTTVLNLATFIRREVYYVSVVNETIFVSKGQIHSIAVKVHKNAEVRIFITIAKGGKVWSDFNANRVFTAKEEAKAEAERIIEERVDALRKTLKQSTHIEGDEDENA